MEAIAKNLRKAAFWRKKGQVVRKEPREEYLEIAEKTVQGIIVLQDGKLRYVNARARGFLKKPIEELTPEVLVNMVHPDDRPMIMNLYAQRLRGEEAPQVYSFRAVAADGRVLWLEFSVSLIEWEGRPATLVLAENITERKKMEATLAESEKTIRALLDASPAVEFLVGSEGKILVYNQAFERFFGRDGKPLTGRNIQDLLSPEEIQVNRGKAMEVLSTGKPVFFEDYQRGMWLEKSFSPILDEEGRVAKIACYGMDISEKKRAAEALKENEFRYRLLAENVSDFIWAADRNLRLTYVSPGVTRLLGYTPEELMAQKKKDRLNPDSVAHIWKVYTQELAKEKKEPKEQPQPQILVLEYRRKDGSTFWAESRVKPVFDSEGNIAFLVGITQDISDRKKAGKDLRESERRYRLLAENATDVIWTTDMNLRLTYVSPAVTRLRGYTPEEAMAEPTEKAYSPDSWALIQKLYAEELIEEKKDARNLSRTRTLELQHRCKDGSFVWAETKISAIRDAEGNIVEILGVTRDISERKEAEQSLRESEKTIRALLDGIPAAEILIDTQGTVLATNRSFDRIYGKDGKPLVGRDLRDLIAPEEYEFNLPKVNEVIRTGKPVFFDDPQRGLWLEKAFYPILDEKGQVTRIACYGRDVSKRKKAEEALRRSEEAARRWAEENALMAEITRIVSSNLNIDEVFERFVEEVRKLIEFENITIVMINPEERSLAVTHVSGVPVPGREVGTILPLDGTATEETYKTRSSLFIHKENLEEAFRKFPKLNAALEAGMQSMIIVPLIRGDRVIGILNILSSKPNAYTRADVEIAEKVATQIAGAIANAQLFQELHRMVEALKESELRNRNLVEATGISGLGIVVFKNDKRGRVLCQFANEEAQKITGYTEEELSRTPFQEIIHPAHREAALSRYWTRVGGDQEPVLYQLVIRHKKGHTVLIEISAIHTAFRGEEGMIGFFRDISERKRTEKELADYRAHLEQMVEERTARIHQLEQQRGEIEKMAATGVLAARIAHEINNPLAGIKGSFMLIQDAIAPDHPYHHYIRRIHTEINRIARIVRQMFELYRPPAEDQEEWGVEQMIQDVVALLKDEARERKVSFQLHILPLKLQLPAGAIRQVLFNLIKNAVEASPPGGVVEISLEERGEGIILRILDQGHGISEKTRPHVFKPFFTTKKGAHRGLGLGLSISKDVIETLGGSIQLKNLKGQGLLCQIDFPERKRKKENKDD
jgi:PAS domain S-box-containing protein